MPRTKVSKSSKRNRDAAAAEHIREMELLMETNLNEIEFKGNSLIAEIEANIQLLISRTNDAVLDLPFSTFKKFNLKKFTDYGDILTTNSSTMTQQKKSMKSGTGNDDGYITEDSASSSSANALATFLSTTRTQGRTPGPLNSARARRPRRSRSACGDVLSHSTLSQKQSSSNISSSTTEHSSRNKLRTPMSARPKAFSADRSALKQNTSSMPKSPPSAFLRWPKPGELVMSVHGSPVVAQVLPDKFANVNIPMRNGIFSLRPKKLANFDAGIVENLDPETLNQIKTLNENLGLIVSLASKKCGNN